MSAWQFSGLVSCIYPESRDANGAHLGQVDPGDIRFFDDGPPDSLMWTPANGDGTAAEDEPAAGEDAEAGTSEGDAPASPRTRRSQPAEPAA